MLLSSLRNFFISLFITLVVFGVAAYFLIGVINESLGNLVTDQTATDKTDNTPTEDLGVELGKIDTNVFTVLVLGIDDGQSQPRDFENDENYKENDSKKEADTIFLINVNAITRVLMISSLPCDMRVEADGYVLRLGTVYSHGEYARDGKGMELVKRAVHAYTGLEADYCFVVDYDSVETIIDSLGAIEYTIPEDMYYKPVPYDPSTTNPPTEEVPTTTQNPEETETTEATTDRNIIDIKRKEQTTNEEGKALIDGAAAIQILRYKNYKNEENSRDLIQISFVREFVRQKMTIENLARADQLYEDIKESIVGTDMDGETLKKYMETLFSIADFDVEIVSYPGSVRVENGTAFFEPIQKSAEERYNKYRRVREADLNAPGETTGETGTTGTN